MYLKSDILFYVFHVVCGLHYDNAITWRSSSMKYKRCVNWSCIPWSMICPTDTRFFVIVGTFMLEMGQQIRSATTE